MWSVIIIAILTHKIERQVIYSIEVQVQEALLETNNKVMVVLLTKKYQNLFLINLHQV